MASISTVGDDNKSNSVASVRTVGDDNKSNSMASVRTVGNDNKINFTTSVKELATRPTSRQMSTKLLPTTRVIKCKM